MDLKGICAFTAAMTMLTGSAMIQPAVAGIKSLSATEMIAFQKHPRTDRHVHRSHRNVSRWHRQRGANNPQRRWYYRRPILPTPRLYEVEPGNSHRIQPPSNDRGMIIAPPPGDLNRVLPGEPTVPLPPGARRLPPGTPIMRPK